MRLRSGGVSVQSVKYRFGTTEPTIHIATYRLASYRPQLVSFNQPTRLDEWCQQNGHQEAISGGFFDRQNSRPLGELWLDGQSKDHTPFAKPWHRSRGGLAITRSGHIHIAPRHELPAKPDNCLLQAGPLLVYSGQNLISGISDHEGFSSENHQFDSDITSSLNPRGAIGVNSKYLFTVAVDGYNKDCWGIRLADLADVFISLGARFALNLDGGGSVSLISGGQLVNKPRSRDYAYEMCRPIYNGILLHKQNGSF